MKKVISCVYEVSGFYCHLLRMIFKIDTQFSVKYMGAFILELGR